MEYEPFDLQRMFIGDSSGWLLLEMLVRTAIMYVFALVVVRMIGKRGLGNLSPFEYVVVFAIAGAAGEPMFDLQIPLLHGMAVLTAVVVLERLSTRLTLRGGGFERLVESEPALLVRDGKMDEEKMDAEQLSTAELLMKLRNEGITNVGQVQYAVLEPSGQLSVFRYEGGDARAGVSTMTFEGASA